LTENYDLFPDLAALVTTAVSCSPPAGTAAARLRDALGTGPGASRALTEKRLREAATAAQTAVIQGFAKAWTEMVVTVLHEGYGCHMTCEEADAAASLWEAAGDPRTADALIAAHAAHDEPGELHSSPGAGPRRDMSNADEARTLLVKADYEDNVDRKELALTDIGYALLAIEDAIREQTAAIAAGTGCTGEDTL
jgi:hypothetical protein